MKQTRRNRTGYTTENWGLGLYPPSLPAAKVLQSLLGYLPHMGFHYTDAQRGFSSAINYLEQKLAKDTGDLPQNFIDRCERFLEKKSRFNQTTLRKYYLASIGLLTHLAVIESGSADLVMPEMRFETGTGTFILTSEQSAVCRSNYLKKLDTPALAKQLRLLRLWIYSESRNPFSPKFNYAWDYAAEIIGCLSEKYGRPLTAERAEYFNIPNLEEARTLPPALNRVITELESHEVFSTFERESARRMRQAQARLKKRFDAYEKTIHTMNAKSKAAEPVPATHQQQKITKTARQLAYPAIWR
jgi:hypothetical protein